jgi:hypothetical protein
VFVVSALIAKWDHADKGTGIKQRQFPIDTKLRVIPDQGFTSLERLDRGVWVHELTTPGDLFIEAAVF